MSWKAQEWARKQQLGSSAAKSVFVVLAGYAKDATGLAWPTQAQLAQDCELGLRTVARAFQSFIQQGLVVVIRKGNQHQPTRYKLTLPWLSAHATVAHADAPAHATVACADAPAHATTACADEGSTRHTRHEHTPMTTSAHAIHDSPLIGMKRQEENVIGTSGREERADATPALPAIQKWDVPDWFMPLTHLPGYRKTSHKRAAASIEAQCKSGGVDPAIAVRLFAEEYEGLRHRYAWSDPVKAIAGKPLSITIAKLLRSTPFRANGAAPHASDGWRDFLPEEANHG